ncbi:MAG: polyprenyl synthetase family protein [Desulfitobacteriaceae bacterium]|nr:polyprenyl synthetase family protein [Desulfitobacteriaceae bacterium]MDD4345540.1 polyprenyl synthetase family protein [Desulfitobacteriaceae bacterium]MDD4401651.1 polyprenyl synthetase family protein [Desulfitobacteriaceae bacterium]
MNARILDTHAPKLINDTLIDSTECYRLVEQKAAAYFKFLYQQVTLRTYVPVLIEDIKSWKYKHNTRYFQHFLGRNNKLNPLDYHQYIKWLDYTGKLDNYLDRSISYIFMRDMGKELDSPLTQAHIRQAVDSIKDQLLRLVSANKADKAQEISLVKWYRKAQEEGVESTMLWLMDKLKTMSNYLPQEMDAENAQRKLFKIIASVLMHAIEEIGNKTSPEVKSRKIEEAIRLGYSYGLTYWLIDDLLGSNVLFPDEKIEYSDLIRTTLITGYVPELREWAGKHAELIHHIQSELRDFFEYIKANQPPDALRLFVEQAYVFFHSQEVDRMKDLSCPNYSNEDLYIPIILKSSYSRLIARSVIGATEDDGFVNRIFYYGIYNQLADDFADMFEDIKEGTVTPYTYYMKYHNLRPDLINPFELYWTVICNLIHNVYHSDNKTCEVILDRTFNELKRFKERIGTEKYNEVMLLFTPADSKFNDIVQNMVSKADGVDFLDKLLCDRMITMLKKERAEREAFTDTIKNIGRQISGMMSIPKTFSNPLLNQTIVNAANYSLEGGGKHIRPLMAWAIGVKGYGLEPEAIIPLMRSLEYMHTASLIYDDLPSQDNADTRRCRPTLHLTYNIAVAELTGLFLTQKAIEELTYLNRFSSQTMLDLIRYVAYSTQEMCKGQLMDLDSKGKQLTLEQLNTMCFYKTGLAFEASLVMPALLVGETEAQIKAIKEFARHAGIAFQIKDDLLDAEGDPDLLGKLTGKDTENSSATFVTILGPEDAQKEMWDHYCQSIEKLADIQVDTTFLKQLLNYIVNRDH